MGTILATHVIWTTYMTWPPGDPRGHWSPLFDFYGRLIDDGHHLNLPDPTTTHYARELAKEPERILTDHDCQIVAQTLGDTMQTLHPAIRLYAAAIETTHVHLLFGPLQVSIATIVGQIKGRTSSAVIANGSERWRKRTWTKGYWKVFAFEDEVVSQMQSYIEQHNLRRGLPAAPYLWIRPALSLGRADCG